MKESTNPAPEFYFELSTHGELINFQEVDGMPLEVALRNNLKADDNPFKFRLPSLPKGNLTLKNGKAQANSKFMRLASGQPPAEGENPRGNMALTLKDNKGRALLGWMLYNAKPIQNTATKAGSKNQEIEIQNLELRYSFYTFSKK